MNDESSIRNTKKQKNKSLNLSHWSFMHPKVGSHVSVLHLISHKGRLVNTHSTHLTYSSHSPLQFSLIKHTQNSSPNCENHGCDNGSTWWRVKSRIGLWRLSMVGVTDDELHANVEGAVKSFESLEKLSRHRSIFSASSFFRWRTVALKSYCRHERVTTDG